MDIAADIAALVGAVAAVGSLTAFWSTAEMSLLNKLDKLLDLYQKERDLKMRNDQLELINRRINAVNEQLKNGFDGKHVRAKATAVIIVGVIGIIAGIASFVMSGGFTSNPDIFLSLIVTLLVLAISIVGVGLGCRAWLDTPAAVPTEHQPPAPGAQGGPAPAAPSALPSLVPGESSDVSSQDGEGGGEVGSDGDRTLTE